MTVTSVAGTGWSRWAVIGVFLLSTFLNYLDRQLLPAAAPLIRQELGISLEQFGWLVTAFSISYAPSALLAGWFLDRVGLRWGIVVAVVAWSVFGAGIGLAGSLPVLLACRFLLGAPQAAVIPGSGKANATFLMPEELAFGGTINQLGISAAGIAAPFLIGRYAESIGWRTIFVSAGLLGFLWVPLWLWITKGTVAADPVSKPAVSISSMLSDPRLWGLVTANVLSMPLYTLWTNWTTLFFVELYGMTQQEANLNYAWIPQLFFPIGGLAGAAWAFRLIRGRVAPPRARLWIAGICGSALLTSALLPKAPSPLWAAVIIGAGAFFTTCMSTNIYAMPIDFWGPSRAGFGVATLTCAYGAMQAAVSPLIGEWMKTRFAELCIAFAPLPLLAFAALWFSIRAEQRRG